MNELELTEKTIYFEAAGIADHDRRSAYLGVVCKGNDELRDRVQSLLDARAAAGTFLDSPPIESAIGSGPPDNNKKVAPIADKRIGRYKLLEQIGEGGFGIVYMADQIEPIQRRVALKIVKAGMDTKHVIARFEAERQALGLMDHPNIAKVLDAGATESGRPYFVMELVRGIPINEYCDDRNLSTDERLHLFVEVCSAVQHAHQKGIVHRDIKPSNILVYSNGDRPVPKIIDFGIAKATQGPLTDKTLFTQFRQFIGTPTYMSPEQAQMSGVDIDTRTDIYSLGVVLYELLTGKTPLDVQRLGDAGVEEICRRIREEETPTPSKRISSLRQDELKTLAQIRRTDPVQFRALILGDLDWIVMKAVEKDRTRRYSTADALAQDIVRHLHGEPVTAVPPSAAYLLRKFMRRNRTAVWTSLAIAASLIVGMVAATVGMLRAVDARQQTELAQHNLADQFEKTTTALDRATSAERDAEERAHSLLKNLYTTEMATAKEEFDQLNTSRVVELVNKYIPKPNDIDLRGFEWRWLWNQCNQEQFEFVAHTTIIRCARFSPDGNWLATGGKDGYVRIWDTKTRELVWEWKGGVHCNGVDFSPDGNIFATQFYKPTEPGGNLILWDVTYYQKPKKLRRFDGGKPRFSQDAQTLAIGDQLVDLFGNEIRRFEGAQDASGQALSQDGTTYVSLNSIGDGGIWDVPSGKLLGSFPRHKGYIDNPVKGVAISPIDANLIVTGSPEGARLWNRTARLVKVLPGTAGAPLSEIAFSTDGKLLAVRQAYGAIRVFETSNWEQSNALRTTVGNTVAFSPVDRDLLVAGSDDGTVRGWSIAPDDVPDGMFDHPAEVKNLKFSPDGRILAVGMIHAVRFWDVENRRVLFTTPDNGDRLRPLRYYDSYTTDFVAWSHDSRFAAMIGPRDSVSVWDIGRQEAVREFTLPKRAPELRPKCWSLEFSPDGRDLYAGVRDGETSRVEIIQWSKGTDRAEHSSHDVASPRSMTVSPDGQLLAIANADATFTIRRLSDFEVLRDLKIRAPGAETETLNLAFSSDGKRLAVSILPPAVTIWDTETWQQRAFLPHTMAPEHVSWSPDGTRLAASDATATTKLWNVETEQTVATFRGSVAEFSPDGTILAVGGQGSYFIGNEKHVGHVTLHYAPSIEDIDRQRANGVSR